MLEKIVTISDIEQDLIKSVVAVQVVRKKQFLMREGESSNECYFVSNGLLRNLIIDQFGCEITTYFVPKNNFVMDYTSFLLETPSLFSIQAIQDSTIVILNRNAINTIHEKVHNGNKLGRLLAESQFIRFIENHNSLYRHTLAEKYRVLNIQIPGIHSLVPQQMIASYLGITRVHLSRLKRNFL